MATFKDLNSLLAYVQKSVNSSLNNEVFEEVKQTEMEHIRSDIYDSYSPKVYDRRFADGGIGDPENIKKSFDDGTSTLTVTNETKPNSYAPSWWDVTTDKSLPEVIEYGQGYDFTGFGYEYENPRPFTQNTIDELQQTGKHVQALREGLRRQGIDTV